MRRMTQELINSPEIVHTSFTLERGEAIFLWNAQTGAYTPHTRWVRSSISGNLPGRGSRTRTRDPRFWRPMLYQLSYTPSGEVRVCPKLPATASGKPQQPPGKAGSDTKTSSHAPVSVVPPEQPAGFCRIMAEQISQVRPLLFGNTHRDRGNVRPLTHFERMGR